MRQISLRQRALEALSRREHSRLELERKLLPHAESEEQLAAVLDTLEQEKLLSNARFVDALSHRRAAKFGASRIKIELAQHGLDDALSAPALLQLKQTELARCHAVWQKKFGTLPKDLAERGKQTRFLLSRGFDAAKINQVLKGRFDEERLD